MYNLIMYNVQCRFSALKGAIGRAVWTMHNVICYLLSVPCYTVDERFADVGIEGF